LKLNIRRLGILAGLLVLSAVFGLVFDGIATAIEKHNYPIEEDLRPLITENADRYGLPEAVLWATVCVGSEFASNAVSSEGAIGLMQITPKQFEFICAQLLDRGEMNAGLLYEPATNVQCGAAWLSYLYQRYNVWDLTFAAYKLGTEEVDAWLTDPRYTDEDGVLKKIPDPDAAAYVNDVTHAVELYTKLYFEP
jgi:soluble lytic murein transglycosylase